MSKFRELDVSLYKDGKLMISFVQYDKLYVYSGTTERTEYVYEYPSSAFNGEIIYEVDTTDEMSVGEITLIHCLDEQTGLIDLEPDYVDEKELINQINAQL